MAARSKLIEVISDLLINLSAGWIGAVFIVPSFSNTNLIVGLPVLTADLIMGIVSLYLSFRLKLMVD